MLLALMGLNILTYGHTSDERHLIFYIIVFIVEKGCLKNLWFIIDKFVYSSRKIYMELFNFIS